METLLPQDFLTLAFMKLFWSLKQNRLRLSLDNRLSFGQARGQGRMLHRLLGRLLLTSFVLQDWQSEQLIHWDCQS